MRTRALIDPNGVTHSIILVEIDEAYPLEPGWSLGDPLLNPVVPPPDPVPQTVSARQLKLALLANGQLDAANSFVAAQTQDVQVSWQTTDHFDRDNAMVDGMATAFGMTGEQVDELFRAASLL